MSELAPMHIPGTPRESIPVNRDEAVREWKKRRAALRLQAAMDLIRKTMVEYGGVIHGDDLSGNIDVEFPTMLKASQWLESVGMTSRAFISAYDADSPFTSTVVVTIES